jgi:hypothetical protein
MDYVKGNLIFFKKYNLTELQGEKFGLLAFLMDMIMRSFFNLILHIFKHDYRWILMSRFQVVIDSNS